MNRNKSGSAILLVVVILAIVTLMSMVVNDTVRQLATLVRNRTIHLQHYYTTRALLELARAQNIQTDTEYAALPFAPHASYQGRVVLDSLPDKTVTLRAELYQGTTLLCSLGGIR